MRSIIALGVVLLLVALAGFFVVLARTIHRDFQNRFDRVRRRLEHDANAIVRNLFSADRPD